ncbi:MAG: ImmA/IrrE family metallo-endopeptidase [Butyricicoccus pullicaecorum]|nr:ImmA/IrrE family metallo-endopeptidase [Butyricicoccus pullicaecorum]
MISALEYATCHDIDVDRLPLSSLDAFSIEHKGKYAIVLDPSKIESSSDENTKLAHELGHCLYGGFYSSTTPLYIREKHEYKANVWAVKFLVPWDELHEAVHNGITEPWELAEYFSVTEAFINLALEYYLERKEYSLN